MSDAGRQYVDTLKTLEATPAWKLDQELRFLAESVNTFASNERQWRSALAALQLPQVQMEVFRADRLDAQARLASHLNTLAHNYLAAAYTLAQHSMQFAKDHYDEGSDFAAEYDERKTADFLTGLERRFFIDLRTYAQHTETLPWTIHQFSSSDESRVSFVLSLTEDLQASSWWKPSSRQYMSGRTEIDIGPIFEQYSATVYEFHRWLRQRQMAVHAKEIGEVAEFAQKLEVLWGNSDFPPTARDDQIRRASTDLIALAGGFSGEQLAHLKSVLATTLGRRVRAQAPEYTSAILSAWNLAGDERDAELARANAIRPDDLAPYTRLLRSLVRVEVLRDKMLTAFGYAAAESVGTDREQGVWMAVHSEGWLSYVRGLVEACAKLVSEAATLDVTPDALTQVVRSLRELRLHLDKEAAAIESWATLTDALSDEESWEPMLALSAADQGEVAPLFGLYMMAAPSIGSMRTAMKGITQHVNQAIEQLSQILVREVVEASRLSQAT